MDVEQNADPLTGVKPDPTAAFSDFLLALVRDREGLNTELLECVAACQTMLDGLPKVIDAMSPDEEGMRLALGQHLRGMKEDGAPEDFLRWAKSNGDGFIEKVLMFTKSVRAIAKTQRTMARHVRNMALLNLVYSMSESSSVDAAKLASKYGRGDEAIKALWKAKFGNAPF